MIEKLKEHDVIDPKTDKVIGKIGCDMREIMDKLNEVIDAVNELQKHEEQHLDLLTQLNEMRLHQNKEPADPYAEQRKWIGKICKFWDNDDTQQLSYGVLTKIDTESGFGVQYCCNDEYDYDGCEPVKPDADIIYKKEQQ